MWFPLGRCGLAMPDCGRSLVVLRPRHAAAVCLVRLSSLWRGVLHKTTGGALEEPVCLFRLRQRSWMLLLRMLREVLLGISAIEGLAGALASRAFVADALQRQRPL
jgi:hypothetical protein